MDLGADELHRQGSGSARPQEILAMDCHDNLEAADRFLIAAEDTFYAIARNPDIGSQRSFRKLVGVRSWPVKSFEKYLIFYKKRDGTVVVGRVIHGMRDLPRFF